jgi:hypothetical protein
MCNMCKVTCAITYQHDRHETCQKGSVYNLGSPRMLH